MNFGKPVNRFGMLDRFHKKMRQNICLINSVHYICTVYIILWV